MTQRPVPVGFVRATVAQEKSEKLLASPHQLRHGVDPGAHQITHRLVNLIGHPHRCQVPRAVLQRQLLRVPPVGLDPIARLSSNQRRRSDDAAMPEIGELAIDAISASAGFIAEFEPTAVLAQSLGELGHVQRRIGDRADEAYCSVATLLGSGDRQCSFVDVETDVERLLHVSSATKRTRRDGAASRLCRSDSHRLRLPKDMRT